LPVLCLHVVMARVPGFKFAIMAAFHRERHEEAYCGGHAKSCFN
jgi:hypothetical protein